MEVAYKLNHDEIKKACIEFLEKRGIILNEGTVVNLSVVHVRGEDNQLKAADIYGIVINSEDTGPEDISGEVVTEIQ